jgi:DNA-binding transcriptional regulator YhcF (GntR family)
VQIVLNRQGGVPIRDQLVTQLELEILAGRLAHGQKLPSVRALARRLSIHHNTISAAYQDLEAAGHVELKRGSGVYVRQGGPTGLPDARGLDEMIRLALHAALQRGYSGEDIRSAVERWLAAAPPDRVVVVDPVAEMAEILRRELEAFGVRALACTPDDIVRQPALMAGALAVALPYHAATVQRLAPGVAFVELTLEIAPADREALRAMPAGSILLVVSHSPSVLPFAGVFLRSLRGDDVVVEACHVADTRRWRRIAQGADLVLVDVMAAAAVKRAKPRRLREFRLVSETSSAQIREALKVVALPAG